MKKKAKKLEDLPVMRNSFVTAMGKRRGAGKHKDRRLKRKDRQSWRKERWD